MKEKKLPKVIWVFEWCGQLKTAARKKDCLEYYPLDKGPKKYILAESIPKVEEPDQTLYSDYLVDI